MKLPKAWPKVVERGHSIVKIYRTPSNGCDQFTLVYYLGDKRIRKSYSDYGLAFTDAETTATKLSEGELNVLELKGDIRMAYARAVEMLRPTGVPLEMAAMHFAEAFRILGGANMVQAAEFYMKHHPSNMPQKTVPEVVAELIETKEGDALSDVYLKDLRGRLGRFREAFKMQIGLVTTGDIERFLREVKVVERIAGGEVRHRAASPKSRNHYRAAIGTLFYFAEARGYVPKGLVDIEAVAVAKQKDGEIEIFRPEELARVLAAADDNLIPFLAIGAFAGLRHAEIQRLDWSEVRLEDGFIEVKAGNAKTASRRLVPITDNLRILCRGRSPAAPGAAAGRADPDPARRRRWGEPSRHLGRQGPPVSRRLRAHGFGRRWPFPAARGGSAGHCGAAQISGALAASGCRACREPAPPRPRFAVAV